MDGKEVTPDSFEIDGVEYIIEDISVNEIEPQRTYTWMRLYLKEDSKHDLQIGDTITMTYQPTGENLECIFTNYGKVGNDFSEINHIVNYDTEDDMNKLILMVDIKSFERNDIPFLRSLFPNYEYFEYQLYKTSDILFENNRNNEKLDYFECIF